MIKIGKNCELDIKKLIATRMLINANSGGGKSWAIRKLMEESHGQVQQILIDLEGEFSTLREKFDYLLVGKDGEIPASIRTAELLARRLLELNVSTIIDLSELKNTERIIFVKRFLDSLINSPKELWHPCLILLDEAHHFAPEGTKSESASAVIDLMTRGRKRGFCGIIATQRISKLSKDAIAEANNCLIGRASLDIDQKRASEVLGFTTKDDARSLRNLKAGEFYVFGSAFKHDGVEKVFIGSIKTTHPDRTRGILIKGSSKTPENIKKILKDVIDLPKQAEEELRTTEDMRRKIQELKTKLTIAERSQVKPQIKIDEMAVERARENGFNDCKKEMSKELDFLRKENNLIIKRDEQIAKLLQIPLPPRPEYKSTKSNLTTISIDTPIKTKPIENIYKLQKLHTQKDMTVTSDTPLRAGAMKMLNWLAGAYPNELSKQRLATLSGFSVKGGTFNTYISELKRNGWIVGSNEISITEEGMKNATPCEIPQREELLSLWKSKFRVGVGKILEFVYEAYPNSVTKEEIGEATNFEINGGTFNTYLSELRRNGLIQIEGSNIKISKEFFE